MKLATFQLLSQNETNGHEGATKEEFLQEIIDDFKDAFEDNLHNLNAQGNDEDYKVMYSMFVQAVVEKLQQYVGNSTGYQQICCLPQFALGLVMASQIWSHYMYTSWFQISTLKAMIEVHGGCE